MDWIIHNWSLLIVVGCFVCVAFFYIKKFSQLPSDEQMTKVKEWLLYAVLGAERIYQSGTGTIKLRYVYDMFLERFPSIATLITFELFSQMVDEALVEMKKILEFNKDISEYVKGE